ncbi:MAG: glycosyltransferase family 8 protein [Myxococcales bacterium]
MTELHVCMATDDNYARHCGVALASIVANAAADDHLRFHVLADALSERSRARLREVATVRGASLEFVKVPPEVVEQLPLRDAYHLSRAAYYRLLIPELLAPLGLARVLYLDCDLVALSSLAPLFETDLGQHELAMAIDEDSETHGRRMGITDRPYFNSGVILFNCPRWREGRVGPTLLEFAREHPDSIQIADQDVLNGALAAGRVRALERTYNVSERLYDDGRPGEWARGASPAILHFVGPIKPWNFLTPSASHRVYFRYLRLTPWEAEKVQTCLRVLPRAARARTRSTAAWLGRESLSRLSPALYREARKRYLRWRGLPVS